MKSLDVDFPSFIVEQREIQSEKTKEKYNDIEYFFTESPQSL